MFKHNNIFSYKFNLWKKYIVERFTKIEKNLNTVDDILRQLKKRGNITLLVWSVRQQYNLPQLDNLDIVSVEDGFIRSVGLGAEYNVPISLIFDKRGIYFDSTTESDLEKILISFDLENEETRLLSHKLINLIKLYRINKYNIEELEWNKKTSRKVITVPGQVESDMSIKYGSPVIKDNLSLLREVRKRNPDAYIVFKVHPDIYKNCRLSQTTKKQYLEYADEVVENFSTFSLIKESEEIHTITSLFGFEALLFNKRVVCYGQPFYSGWGLTEDIYPVVRRQKKLTLEQLVYAVYFIYPKYVSLFSSRNIDVFEAIDEILFIKNKLKIFKPNLPLRLKLARYSLNIAKKTFILINKKVKEL